MRLARWKFMLSHWVQVGANHFSLASQSFANGLFPSNSQITELAGFAYLRQLSHFATPGQCPIDWEEDWKSQRLYIYIYIYIYTYIIHYIMYYISTGLSQSSSVLACICNPIMNSNPADCNQPLLQYHAIAHPADCDLPIPEKYTFSFRIILKS